MSLEPIKIKHPITKILVSKVNQSFSSAYRKSDTTSSSDLKRIRNTLHEKSRERKKSRKIIFSRTEMEGIPVEITSPKNKMSENMIFYIHGGAYMIGLISYSQRYAEMLAVESGCTVYAIDYSLSPENQYPVALDECEKVYLKLRKDHPQSKIAFIGDSAGGGFCVSLTLRLKAKHLAMPSCMVVHSPVMDLSGKLDRTVNVNQDEIIRPSRFHIAADIYAGTADTKNDEISPVYGDYTNFPPVFITVDKHETMFADSIELDRLIEKAGGIVKTVTIDGSFHAFAVMGMFSPESAKLMKEYTAFIRQNF